MHLLRREGSLVALLSTPLRGVAERLRKGYEHHAPPAAPPLNFVPASALLLVEPLRPQAARISEVSGIGWLCCGVPAPSPRPPAQLCTCPELYPLSALSPAPPPVRVPEAERRHSRCDGAVSVVTPLGPSLPAHSAVPVGGGRAPLVLAGPLLYQVRVRTQLLWPECLLLCQSEQVILCWQVRPARRKGAPCPPSRGLRAVRRARWFQQCAGLRLQVSQAQRRLPGGPGRLLARSQASEAESTFWGPQYGKTWLPGQTCCPLRPGGKGCGVAARAPGSRSPGTHRARAFKTRVLAAKSGVVS